ncbi:hypothetical protein P154DRAFT_581567 [Amniculicola lignicola CBS 123094]|uniref:NmrA-like domain-containing protein n=1 Tax=Amniculicola lignicola CBS 123094 TaxID=1392246 RepID=A0A6A5VYT5_9PLEO|nr:hypothetical protein P154DRAFT_581567 [Amniculicola lignicola CBS 123094]
MAIERVLVIGNRDVSRSIIGALIPSSPGGKGSHYRVTILTYPSQTPHLPSHVHLHHITHVTSDFSSPSLTSAFKGHDIIIVAVPGGDTDFQIRIINAAVSAGVPRYIPYEFGQDTLNTGVQERLPKYLERARVIEYLQDICSEHQSFEWVGVAVGCILDRALLTGDLGFDMQWQSATIHGTGNERFAVSSIERVGVVVESLIQQWGQVRNRYIYAAGTVTSANDIISCLETISGSKWTIGCSDVDECVREGRKRIGRGFLDSGVLLLERSVLYDQELSAVERFLHSNSDESLHLTPETTEKIAEKALHELEHRGVPDCGCA